MQAVGWTKYGPPEVLQLQEIEKPSPKANEVLIKVYATTVTAGDCEARAFKFPPLLWLPLRLVFGLTKPRKRILGQEVAGEVEAVGHAVTRFQPGDQLFAATLLRFGGYAQYVCLPESYPMARKPANMSYAEAATVPTGGLNGLHFIQCAQVQPGESVLLNGAGGSIGTYALQIAKSIGAEVTCVDSATKVEMLRALGADHVIDYTRADFTQQGTRYDVIIDIVGKSSFADCVRALKPRGRYVLGNPTLAGMIRGQWTTLTTDKRVLFELANYRPADVAYLIELIDAGKLKAVIDRTYPLAQIVAAHTYVETGRKAGNVVITLDHTGS
jgi:NADPH:quinone reductase-like Zn-dependent oxidoreductase